MIDFIDSSISENNKTVYYFQSGYEKVRKDYKAIGDHIDDYINHTEFHNDYNDEHYRYLAKMVLNNDIVDTYKHIHEITRAYRLDVTNLNSLYDYYLTFATKLLDAKTKESYDIAKQEYLDACEEIKEVIENDEW
jgi:hypothetical protein